ncbi:hypothetical protein GCM10008986_16800 [Salinibacillus aidingensis]|uniref:Phage-related minor tail protein n=1 Tax=Salinibacillus aidingensis TaxID=237684 RepID=A0ABP3L1G2_9BACI
MARRVEGLSIDLDLNTQALNRGLKGAKDSLKTVNSEMKANMSAFDRADQSVEKYETRIQGLNKKLKAQERVTSEARKEYDRMIEKHGEGSKEAEKAAREYNKQAASLNNLDRYVNNATEELEQMRQEQRRAESRLGKLSSGLDTFSGNLDNAGQKMTNFGQTMSASVTAPIVGLGAMAVESTRDFRVNIARLETNAKEAGLGVDVLHKSMKDLNGITGETDSNVEALSNLMATDMNSNQLQQAVDDLSGAVVKFPDTLKIESLADGLQETVATGKAVGPFAELLERMGVDLETFDEGLAEAKESGDELNYALNELNNLDLSKVNKEFRETNKSLVEAREEQYDFQESFAELGEKLEPIATELTERVTDIVDAFNELEPETQDNIIKFAGLAAAAGPAGIALGGVTTTFSNLSKGASKLTDMLGRGSTGGRGLLGRIMSLSRGGVVGLAIGGVAGLGLAINGFIKKTNEAEEVNLDFAKSMSDQAANLEKNVATFERLSDKANVSNDELARLNDLNKRISESSNPGEINELQKQYNNLARESGLSKEELQNLFDANKDIIEQSPDVQTSISETGNKFVESTEKVKEYIDKIRDYSETELEIERAKLLDQQQEALDTLTKKKKEQQAIDTRINNILDAREMTNEEITKSMGEIEEKLRDSKLSEQEWNELKQKQIDLADVKNGKEIDLLEELQNQRKEIKKNIDQEQEKIDKLQATNQQLANIYLKNVGINEEGEKGLKALDKSIEKNKEEILKLQEKRNEKGKLTQEEQKRLEKLRDTTAEQEEQKLKIFEELGIYKNINSLLDAKLSTLSKEEEQKIINLARTRDIKVEEGNILQQLQKKNDKLLEERNNLIKNLEKQGATKYEIREQVSELDKKILKNDNVIKEILKETGLWEQVKDEINLGRNAIDKQSEGIDNVKDNIRDSIGLAGDLNDKLSEPVWKTVSLQYSNTDGPPQGHHVPVGYAVGTNFHPGGVSWLGEEGPELVEHNNKWSLAGFGLFDVPRGAHVYTNDESKKILSALNNIPGHAEGVSPTGEVDRIIGQLNNQSPATSESVVYITMVNEINGRELSRQTFEYDLEFQKQKEMRDMRARGME